jgi:hypothetical protein
VALDIISTEINAEFSGKATLKNGAAYILAASSSEDATNGFATAMGSDMERYTKKFKAAEDTADDAVNKVTEGTIYDQVGQQQQQQNSQNRTASNINTKVNGEQDPNGSQTSNNTPVSSGILKSQGAQQDGTAGSNTTQAGLGEARDASGQNAANGAGGEKQKIQVAAAVGLTVSKHKANTIVNGTIKAARGASILAGNEGNFSTLGTGVAMSRARSTNSIAAGVAISVNRNEANVSVSGTIDGYSDQKGDVTIAADLTQNTTGAYRQDGCAVHCRRGERRRRQRYDRRRTVRPGQRRGYHRKGERPCNRQRCEDRSPRDRQEQDGGPRRRPQHLERHQLRRRRILCHCRQQQ